MAHRVQDIYPLSALQQGMLFHSVSDEVPGIYCEQVVGETRSDLDTGCFRAALQCLIDRHETLRTAFVWQDVDEPVQVVLDNVPVPMTERDWTALDEAARKARLAELLDSERRSGFNLGEAPLFRVVLVRVDPGHLFVLTFHHAILDGWSLSVLLRDLMSMYEASGTGATPTLQPHRPFRDYVAWLGSRDAGPAEGFWRDELRGFAAATPLIDSLAARGSRPGAVTHAEETVQLSESATAAARAAARRCGVTLNTFVQGAWALLLSRIASQDDVAFGVLISGRPAVMAGIESMTGVFINTIPLRVRVPNDRSVAEFLHELQAHNNRLREHDHVALGRIQAVSELPAGRPIFESVLIFENYPVEIENPPRDASWRFEIRSLQLTNYPLHLMVVPGPRLLLDLTFDVTAVAAPFAAQIVRTFGALIEALAERLDAPLESISLLPDGRPLPEATGAERARPAASFRELFEAQSISHADRPAVRDGCETWTYRELQARAQAGARRLTALGAGPEVVVALLGRRDRHFLAAMLSVLTAEAAFLPLDPQQPLARLLEILERSRTRILVTDSKQTALADALRRRGGAAPAILDLSTLTDPLAGAGAWQPPAWNGPGQLAYIIYTSGSSGVPKGAMIEQRGLINHLFAKIEELALDSFDIVGQTAPACFDISIWQLLAPLLAGASVQIFPDDVAFDGTRLPMEAGRARVTVLETVPTLLGAMLDDLDRRSGSAPSFDGLRLMLSTGEPLPAELCRAWLARFPRVPVINAYGPTECSDDVTHHVVDVPPEPGVVPIGRALPNTQLYVVDHRGRPLPPGFVGDLLVGGDGVGRGYVGDPARTADVFLDGGVCGSRSARVYRTGDRARLLPGGVFEYIGRRDDQVKVHGHRIELGEIEAHLTRHPCIAATAVVATPARAGSRLAAFVVLRAPVDDIELRAFLRDTLPDYMVPAVFVRKATLPLTPNGKIDRRSLLEDARDEPPMGTLGTAPAVRTRDEIETALVRVWSEVLQRSNVGIDQNFFELGGDSILIMQVVSRARQAGLSVTVRQMFEHQTIEGVASALRGGAAASATAGTPATGPTPLSPIQSWFFELSVPTRSHWNMSVRLTTRERIDAGTLRQAVEALVQHHEALRYRFTLRGGEWSADIAPRETHDIVSRVDVSSVGDAMNDQKRRQCEADLQRRLDISQGPLLRVALFDDASDDTSEVLLVAHHLVVDAVSWQILVEDLETAYAAIRDGRAPRLPEPTTSFRTWIAGLRRWAESEAMRAEWDYWLHAHAGRRARLRLDGPRAANTEGGAAVREIALDGDATRTLIRQLPLQGIATHDVLLAALGEALARHSSDGMLVVDIEGHGRHGPVDGVDLTRTVGWFTALYPRSLGPGLPLGVFERYARIRAGRGDIPHDGIGYGLLRQFGDPSLVEALRALALPEVSFNYFGQVDAPLSRSALFAIAREGCGPDRDPLAGRPHVLDVSAGVFDGRLRLLFLHAAGCLRPSTVEALAYTFVEALEALIASPEKLTTPASKIQIAPAATDDRDAPLSFSQQGLWFLEQVHPGTPVSNSSTGFYLEGPLDIGIVQRAIDEIAARHETLRTVYPVERGLPVARVSDDVRIVVRVDEMPAGSSEDIQQRVAVRAAADARQTFDLSADPPLRVSVLRAGPHAHVLLVTAHHIAFDGWSFGIFGRELLALYQAWRVGLPSPLPPLSLQYADFARSQRTALTGSHLARLLDRARRRLEGAAAVHDFPTDRARPATLGVRGLRRHRDIPAALSESIRSFAQTRGTTTFIVLLTAFQLALARRSRTKDLLVGGTAAGRPRPELETLIGVFVNTVVMRTNMTGVVTFDAALSRTATAVVEALEDEELPFELLVQELGAEVRTSHAPVVQIGFAMQNMPMPAIELPGLKVRPIEIDSSATRADMVLFATDKGDLIRLSLELNTDLFDPETADDLLCEIDRSLADGVGSASLSMGDLATAEMSSAELDARLRELVERP